MDPEFVLFAAVFLVCLGIFVAVFVTLVWRRLAKARTATVRVEGEGLHVPLVAAFSGFKGVPWLSFSHNSLSPLLVLYPDRIECRVVRRRSAPYAAIARVDYRSTIGTENVVVEFTESVSTFVGNTANRDLARQTVRHLRDRGCPLSERAARLADAPV